MARTPFALHKRNDLPYRTSSWYVRFWSVAEKRYLTAVSIAKLAEELEIDIEATPPHSKAGATCIALEYLKKGLPSRHRERMPLANEYLESFWTWETSDYIKGKLARKADSIGRQYVRNNLSWIRRYFSPRFMGVRLNQVRTLDVEKLLVGLREDKKLNPRTINLVLQAISIPFSEALRLGVIKENPITPIRKFGETTVEKGILTNAEVQTLLNMPWPDPRYYVAFLVALFGGLRLGEVVALRRQAIALDHIKVEHSYSKIVGLKSTKTNKNRNVPLPEFVIQAIKTLVDANPHGEDWVFHNQKRPGRPIGDTYIEDGFYAALAMIGITDDPSDSPSPESRQGRRISFHSLRHWNNATLRGALPDEKLRMLTGHSSVQMSNHYDHVTEHDLEAIRKAQEQRILSLRQVSNPDQADTSLNTKACASRKRSKSSDL